MIALDGGAFAAWIAGQEADAGDGPRGGGRRVSVVGHRCRALPPDPSLDAIVGSVTAVAAPAPGAGRGGGGRGRGRGRGRGGRGGTPAPPPSSLDADGVPTPAFRPIEPASLAAAKLRRQPPSPRGGVSSWRLASPGHAAHRATAAAEDAYVRFVPPPNDWYGVLEYDLDDDDEAWLAGVGGSGGGGRGGGRGRGRGRGAPPTRGRASAADAGVAEASLEACVDAFEKGLHAAARAPAAAAAPPPPPPPGATGDGPPPPPLPVPPPPTSTLPRALAGPAARRAAAALCGADPAAARAALAALYSEARALADAPSSVREAAAAACYGYWASKRISARRPLLQRLWYEAPWHALLAGGGAGASGSDSDGDVPFQGHDRVGAALRAPRVVPAEAVHRLHLIRSDLEAVRTLCDRVRRREKLRRIEAAAWRSAWGARAAAHGGRVPAPPAPVRLGMMVNGNGGVSGGGAAKAGGNGRGGGKAGSNGSRSVSRGPPAQKGGGKLPPLAKAAPRPPPCARGPPQVKAPPAAGAPSSAAATPTSRALSLDRIKALFSFGRGGGGGGGGTAPPPLPSPPRPRGPGGGDGVGCSKCRFSAAGCRACGGARKRR